MKKLWDKNFSLIWSGQLVSLLGTQSYQIASILWLKENFNSAKILSILVICSTIPAIIFGPLGGTIADKNDKKKLMVLCDFFSGLGVLTVVIALFYYDKLGSSIVYVFYLQAFFVAMMQSIYGPTVKSSIPLIVEKSNIAGANSALESMTQVVNVAGQGLGSLLYQIIGGKLLILFDSISYILSALSEMFITFPSKEKTNSLVNLNDGLKEFIKETIDGFKYVYKNTGLWRLCIFSGVLNLFISPIVIVFPFYIESSLNENSASLGYLMAMIGVGSILGVIMHSKILKNNNTLKLFCFFIAIPLSFLSLYLISKIMIAYTFLFIFGFSTGVINIFILTQLQIKVDSNYLGRVFGLLYSFATAMSPIGVALTGILLEKYGNEYSNNYFLVAAVSLIFVISYNFTSEKFREFLRN